MLHGFASAKSASTIGAAAAIAGNRQLMQTGPMRQRFLLRPAVTLMGLDFVLMAAAVAGFIFAIRERLGFVDIKDTISAIVCLVLASIILAYGTGAYRQDSFLDFSTATTRLAVGLGVGVLFLVPLFNLGLGLFFDSPAFLSVTRSLTIVLIGAGAGLCSGMLSRVFFMAMARRQWFGRTILVIGSGKRARYLRDILARADRRLTQVYFLTETYLGGTAPADVSGQVVDGLSAASSPDELATTLHVDQVVLAVDDAAGLRFDHLLPWKATGIPVLDFNSFLERETGRVDITWTEPDWLLYSEGFRFGYLDRALKRLLDVLVSASLLLLTLPALLIVAALVVLDDFGPIFYRQERVSYAGRRFWIIKFRTMRVNAEANGATWACENDPRTTRIGRILRRTRVDEIPQLINVLRGDMSLVGPRPERPVFVEDLSQQIRMYHLRHSVKAGLTGWAQINYPYGASVEDAARKLEYDLYYLKHFSLVRDIAIMLQTLRILLFAKGGR
jgi:sugar transferase (PEP-CTERM system associated)